MVLVFGPIYLVVCSRLNEMIREEKRSEYIHDRYHKEESLWWKWGGEERSVCVFLRACWDGGWCDHKHGRERLHLRGRRRRPLLCGTHHTGSSSLALCIVS